MAILASILRPEKAVADSDSGENGKDFGWYTKRVAVYLSYGYLTLFVVSGLLTLVPRLASIAGWGLFPNALGMFLADGLARYASSGYGCEPSAFDDQIQTTFIWSVAALFGWFQFFLVGLLAGGVADAMVALTRSIRRRAHA